MALAPQIEVRLEARQIADRAEYVDLACSNGARRTLIELKCATAGWTGSDLASEEFAVRNHAAYDLARRYFIHDVHRLETFTVAQPGTDGIAIMLTNVRGLWADSGVLTARDVNFRIHDDRTFTGQLIWGTGNTPQDDKRLSGTYTARWRDYSDLEWRNGRFRWLALPVVGSAITGVTAPDS